jgi:hypothetical protein
MQPLWSTGVAVMQGGGTSLISRWTTNAVGARMQGGGTSIIDSHDDGKAITWVGEKYRHSIYRIIFHVKWKIEVPFIPIIIDKISDYYFIIIISTIF